MVRKSRYTVSGSTPGVRSVSGTTIGGSAAIRSRPSTTSASLPKACRLSRERALPSARSTFLRPRPPNCSAATVRSRSASVLAYHTSRLRIPANRAIDSRYERTEARTIPARSRCVKPFARPAMTRLAASRLTSHSQGPGSVSSKSLMSKSRFRSGEASNRKFSRWASPHNCARIPESGVPARSAAIRAAAPR